MSDQIKVMVSGANGRMGQEVVKMVLADKSLVYAGGIDIKRPDVAFAATPFYTSLKEAIIAEKPDVIVDFTTPKVVKQNMETTINLGVRPIVWTTGLTLEDLQYMDKLARSQEIGGLVAPNFAIGAILMMKASGMFAKYMPYVEIIEMHHDKKLDAPSGTSLKTAEIIAAEREKVRQGDVDEKESIQGVRGGDFSGFKIHSVRLPGLVAHQEVIFGAQGQTLTIRHDSMSRESFMPGVNLAIKKVKDFTGIVYGLEHLLD